MRKSSIITLICIAALVPVSANSALKEWTGTSETGAIPLDEDCPIIVEKENLTFDIDESLSSGILSDVFASKNTVTAEYTFHNPETYAIDARLVFPMEQPENYGGSEQFFPQEDAYEILVHGESVPVQLRATYQSDAFAQNKDLAMLNDDFVQDDFYHPELPVYEYVFHTEIRNKPKDGTYIDAECVISADSERKLTSPDMFFLKTDKDQITMGFQVEEGDDVTVYAIGKPLELPLEWSMHDTSEEEKPVDGNMLCQKVGEMTLMFLDRMYFPEERISDQDCFNFMTAYAKEREDISGLIADYCEPEIMKYNILWWYDYNLHFEPGETLINTVRSSIYPSIDAHYEPPVLTFRYLLSPASTWKEFHDLTVLIHTDLFLTWKSDETLQKTEGQYQIHYDTLPAHELEFTLCKDASPVKEKSYAGGILIFLFLSVLLPVLAVIFLIRFLIRLFRKR